VVVLVERVVPEVDAPDGFGWFALVVVIWICSGLIPDVDGVGEEEVELRELLSVGNAGAGDGASGAARGAGAGAVAGVEGMASVGPNGCSRWTNVQLY